MFSRSITLLVALSCLDVSNAKAIPTSHIKWVDCSKNAPDQPLVLNMTTVDLSSLPKTLHCGRIDVPMDYTKPLCSENKITLDLAMYRPTKPKGTIF